MIVQLRAAAVALVRSQNVCRPDVDLRDLASEAASHGLALVGERELALLRLAVDIVHEHADLPVDRRRVAGARPRGRDRGT